MQRKGRGGNTKYLVRLFNKLWQKKLENKTRAIGARLKDVGTWKESHICS